MGHEVHGTLTHNVEHKADEAVVGGQGQQHLIHQQNMLEVVNDTLSVQEVHGGGQEIPIQRFGEAQILFLAGNIGNGDNLLKRNNLDRRHDAKDVDVAGEHGDEEAGNHDKGPYCPGNKGLLLLFVLGQWGFVGFLCQFRRISSQFNVSHNQK